MIIYLITLFLLLMTLIVVSFIMNVLFLSQTKIVDAFRVVCTETGSFSVHVSTQARRDRSKSLKGRSGRNCNGAGHALMKRAAHAAVDGNADPSLYDPSV